MSIYSLSEKKGNVGVLTLNSEKTLNALSTPMIEELHAVLKQWKSDESIACVFIQGAGEKAFCAGGDVRNLYDAIIDQRKTDSKNVSKVCLEFFTKEYKLDYEIHTYPKPIIVWGDGIVMGGGIGLLAGASHRIVTEKSKLAMPEITIGLYPDVAGTWFLNKMPAGWGLYLGMTGTRLSASDCLYLGLAHLYVPSHLKNEILQALEKVEWTAAVDTNKKLITAIFKNRSNTNTPTESAAKMHEAFVSTFENVTSVAEFKKALLSYPEKDDWIKAGIKNFESGSPSSAHIIFEQLKRGKKYTLEEVFQSELNLSAQCTLHPDFAEGVRALLVDKDQDPKWQPATLNEVTTEWIESYFTPLWEKTEHPLYSLKNNMAWQK
jgi:enoyl-CoA hydratase/carnithine racemase